MTRLRLVSERFKAKSVALCVVVHYKSIPWLLAEFYYNGGLQRPHTCTCTILQETVNRLRCLLIVFS